MPELNSGVTAKQISRDKTMQIMPMTVLFLIKLIASDLLAFIKNEAISVTRPPLMLLQAIFSDSAPAKAFS